jgi:hypothetical protein
VRSSAAADKPDRSWPNPADSAKNCLFRKIQRSPRPGLKQKANQYSGEPKFTSQSTSSFQSAGNTNCDTHGKVNRSAPKVNPFFGSLLIKIFQKQDLLKSEKTAMLSRQ